MFWPLLVAHLIADFPLQSTWMARNKVRLRVLLAHVSIHFVVMLAVTFPASLRIWPALLALAAIHFGIDTGKNWFTIHRRQWVVWPYLIDQLCHVISLALLAAWLEANQPAAAAALPRGAAVVLAGFLLVTFVWQITERILRSRRPAWRTGPGDHTWMRLAYRAILLAALLGGWGLAAGRGQAAAPAATLLLAYPKDRAGLRALAADLGITTLVAVLVILINEGTG
jgi:hypothetical protein